MATTDGTRLTTSDGWPVQTRNDQVLAYDNKSRSRFWNILPESITGVFSVQSTPNWTERVRINAPTVPEPAAIQEDFNESVATFDGTDDDRDAAAQREEFSIFARETARPE
jgi:hypothetical protein